MALGMGCRSSARLQFQPWPARASQWGHYEVSTKFVDDTVVQLLAREKANQVVFCSDQVLDRVRLHRFAAWSSSAPLVIFDVSPAPSSNPIRLSTGRILRHVACDTLACGECTEALVAAGYRGDRNSIWTAQGLDSCASSLLEVVSIHAMKGSYYIADLFHETWRQNIPSEKALLHRRLLGYGFELLSADTLSCSQGDCFFFVSKQLRLSAEQVSFGLKEIEMAEEVEEDGFEEW